MCDATTTKWAFTPSCYSAFHSTDCPLSASLEDLDRQYTATLFRNLTGNLYAGPPSDEIDTAWNLLLAPMHVRITREELERDNQASVPLPEGGGYLGWMGVFHELHCVVSAFFPPQRC